MTNIASKDDTVRVIQFTDLHLFSSDEGKLLGVNTSQSFQQVMQAARQQRPRPDFVLLTGDLAQEETADTYKKVAALIKQMDAPVFFLPGNHDDAPLMREVLAPTLAGDDPDESVISGNWNIILLNSVIPGQVGGFLQDTELNRLDKLLSRWPNKHALVCLHHHPVPIGCEWIDNIGLSNADEFFSVISRHPQVKGILWGHIHQEFEKQMGSLLLMATPSTCVQFKPGTSGFTLDTQLPGYRWLELKNDGNIHTEVSRLQGIATGVDLSASGY